MNDRAPYRLSVSCPPDQRVEVPPALLNEVESLYNQSRYLDAGNLAFSHAPLHCWKGPEARILASRLASRLEGNRLSDLLSLSAWREDPKAALTCLYHGYDLWKSRGPLVVWEFTEDYQAFTGLTPAREADILALRARVAGAYRDFELARRLMDESLRKGGNSAWLLSEKASILATEERLAEAMDWVGQALAVQPWFRPAVHLRATLLQKERRIEETAAWLDEARRHGQSAEIIGQCIGVRRELNDHDGMEELLDAYEVQALLLEEDGKEWLAARRCDLLCLRGDWEAAATQAEIAKGKYYEALAAKLRAGKPSLRRVKLSPPHVIQRHNTCGPSTLAMLAGFWNHEATHDVIADAICYDGTYDHTERQWCLDNGLATREFTVNWESSTRLLDAGIPFALATVEVNSAHMQAVVGYDEVRGTLLVQDPSSLLYREIIAESLAEEYALHGPRGLAVVPESMSARLDAIELPDAEWFDFHFAFNRALHHHRRDEAAVVLASMVEKAPEHPLRYHMESGLAYYDDDQDRAAAATEALGKLFPNEPRLVARQVHHARRSAGRQEVLELLRKAATAKDAHPCRWRDLAIELSSDARESRESWKWLRKAHAAMPYDSSVVEAWADRWWTAGKKARATDAYGFASSWSPTDERLANAWFNAERFIGQREQALNRLRARYRQFGHRSPDSGRTLLWALDDFHHDEEAMAVLRETLEKHPGDGQFLLTASAFHTSRGQHAEAQRYLAEAENKCPKGVWARTRARAESAQGRHKEALAIWREIEIREPMATDAHGQIAWLLSLLESEESALRHLDETLRRFPHHLGLHRLRLSWLREAYMQRAESAVRALIDVHPTDAWAWRELAVALGKMGRREEAVAAARTAHTLAPHECASSGILASALESTGRVAEAKEWHRAALSLDVDYTFSQHRLLGLATDASERRKELRFIHDQMIRQVLEGAAIAAYHELAFPLLDQEALLKELEEIHRARPDIFESWNVLTRHLMEMGRLEEARSVATEATSRLSRLPGIWLTAARAHWFLPDRPAALACARTATELNPDWPDGWQLLADYTEDAGQPALAVEILENAIRRIPNAPSLRAFMAGLLWRVGQRERAYSEALTVAKRFPSDDASWHRLSEWAEALGRRDDTANAARSVCAERPGEARSWLRLARALARSAPGEALAAYDQAIALNPRLCDAYDEKARLLSQQGRFTEAEAACRPAAFGDEIPYHLLGRAAWLLYHRGKSTDAIKRMEELLEIHPDYFWGWRQILEWATEIRNGPLASRARAAMVRLAPNSTTTLCEAGDGELESKNEEEASRYFQLAMARDPFAPYPLNQWLRLAWKKRDVAAIEEAATRALPGLPQAITEAFLILARAYRYKHAEVKSRLDKLLAAPEPIGPVVADMERGFSGLAQNRAWKQALRRAGKRGDIGMSFASAWITAELAARRWHAWKCFDSWIQRAHEEAIEPICHYFRLLGESKKARKATGFFQTKSAAWCRERGRVFGEIGYALVCAEWWSKAIEWLAGAEDRDDAHGWLCTNLVLAFSESNREDEASAVAEKVITRELRDHTWACSASQAALGRALAGDAPAARLHLQEAGGGDKANFWKWKWLLAGELCAVLELPPGSKEASKRQSQAIKSLKHFACNSFPRMSKPMQRLYRRVIRAMAVHSGKRLWPWAFYLNLPMRLWD